MCHSNKLILCNEIRGYFMKEQLLTTKLEQSTIHPKNTPSIFADDPDTRNIVSGPYDYGLSTCLSFPLGMCAAALGYMTYLAAAGMNEDASTGEIVGTALGVTLAGGVAGVAAHELYIHRHVISDKVTAAVSSTMINCYKGVTGAAQQARNMLATCPPVRATQTV